MKKRLLLPLFALALSGCMGAAYMTDVRNDLEDQLEHGHFRKVVGVQVGPALMGIARWAISLTNEEDAHEVRSMMQDFHRAYVRVYELNGELPRGGIRTPRTIRHLERMGWETAVRVRDEDSNVWMLFKERHNDIRDLYIVILDDEDLVMVRAQGRFSRLVEKAMRMNENNHEG